MLISENQTTWETFEGSVEALDINGVTIDCEVICTWGYPHEEEIIEIDTCGFILSNKLSDEYEFIVDGEWHKLILDKIEDNVFDLIRKWSEKEYEKDVQQGGY